LSERFCPRDGTALRSAAGQGDLLGTVVADRYHILKKLGAGGMGTVYLAEHVKMGRKSALKVMNPGMNADPDAIARFNREAANASRLNHPNVCGIYDFGETPDGTIYLAMEFIEGASLTDVVEQAGVLAPSRAASIVHQTADALQVAHDAGIVHRDLKPDNIMVARNVTTGGTSTGGGATGGTAGGISAGTTTAPQPDPTPTTPAEPSAAELAARLPTLLREAQGGNGARVLRDLAALQPRLSGQPLAESYYVQMIAYTSLEDQDGVCAAAKQVIARHETSARVQLARRAADLMQCGGGAL
ncbi:MAG: serine/threonine-protein kinase, partial [Gemmatimonadota bacterium]